MSINYTGLNPTNILGSNKSKVNDLFILLNSISSDSIDINIVFGTKGETDTQGFLTLSEAINIEIPEGSGGMINTSNYTNTFLTYEQEVSLVHELNHAVLAILGLPTTDELNIAVLAEAGRQAIEYANQFDSVNYSKNIVQKLHELFNITSANEILETKNAINELKVSEYDTVEEYEDALEELNDDLEEYEKDATGWSDSDKINIAKYHNASYENLYKDADYFFESGLTNDISLQRTGYHSHFDWTDYGTPSDAPNSYINQLNAGNDIRFLGNKYDNTLESSTTGTASDYLDGGHGNDTLVGNGGSDILIGGTGNDSLYSSTKTFTEETTEDNAVDTLNGGSGFDTYHVGNGDIITDDITGNGHIYFNNHYLSGEKTLVKDTNGYLYEDSKYSYALENPNGVGKLTILEKNGNGGFTGKEIIVNNFNATKEGGYLGIELAKKHVDIYVGDATALEGNKLEFTVGIDTALDYDLVLHVDSYFDDNATVDDIAMLTDKTLTIKAGKTSATYSVDTKLDEIVEGTETFRFAVTGIEEDNGKSGVDAYEGNDLGTYLIKNLGTGIIKDNDETDTLYVSISAVSDYEGNWDDNNQLSFVVKASRALKGDETATLDLNIYDIDTDSSDYGYLSQDSVTFDSTHQEFVLTLDIFGDEEVEPNESLYISPTVVSTAGGIENVLVTDVDIATCRELKIANNMSICSLHVEQEQRKVA